MKKQIIELIADSHNLALTAIKGRIDGAEGEFNYYYQRKDGKPSNILLVERVSMEFIRTMTELHEEGMLESQRTNFMIAAHDSGEFYNLKIARDTKRLYKKLKWLPILIVKGPNFNISRNHYKK